MQLDPLEASGLGGVSVRAMLMFSCAGCGKGLPVPDNSTLVHCPDCGRFREFHWFESPNAYDKWLNWAVKSAARVPSAPVGPEIIVSDEATTNLSLPFEEQSE